MGRVSRAYGKLKGQGHGSSLIAPIADQGAQRLLSSPGFVGTAEGGDKGASLGPLIKRLQKCVPSSVHNSWNSGNQFSYLLSNFRSAIRNVNYVGEPLSDPFNFDVTREAKMKGEKRGASEEIPNRTSPIDFVEFDWWNGILERAMVKRHNRFAFLTLRDT